MTTAQRYRTVIEYFEKERPVANSELNYRNAVELLVAVILSAQCTDKRVNMVTPALFEAYPDAEAMAKASAEDFDWDTIFEGARWFHWTGITPALSDNLVEICLQACKKAKIAILGEKCVKCVKTIIAKWKK